MAEKPPKFDEYPDMPLEIAHLLELTGRVRKLIAEATLKSHQEAKEIIDKAMVDAVLQWDSIHFDGNKRKAFSDHSPRKVNDFVGWLFERLNFDESDLILSIGSGFCNDEIYMAENSEATVLATDASASVINSARAYASNRHWDLAINNIDRPKIHFKYENYTRLLQQFMTSELRAPSVVYSHSSIHYTPYKIFEDEMLPSIATILKKNVPKEEYGKFCLAIKTAQSDSARGRYQHVLSESPYRQAIHQKDRLFRFYPEDKGVVLRAMEPYFNVDFIDEKEVEDYDKVGDTECFIYIVAIPKG